MKRMTVKRPKPTERKGIATLEFALVLPLFLTLMLGTVEFGVALHTSQRMITAAKSGARFASMDWSESLAEGESPNTKVITDVRNFLTASGVPGDEATITITHAEGPNVGNEFDLADEDNDLELFKVEIEIPYTSVSVFPNRFFGSGSLREIVVQRAGRSTLSD